MAGDDLRTIPLHRLSATTIAGTVAAQQISATEVLEDHIDRIRALDPALNCFTDLCLDRARAAAATVDARIATGECPKLAGVPVAVKNLFNVSGLKTRAGSKILRDQPPATHDAEALARLVKAGAVPLGTLNMDEFAYGFVTENTHDGPTRNPHDPTRSAGGSSGGSAAAVAAGLAPLTLGSDTNGSIRVPAALCGVFGLKPTYGALPREGSFPFVDSLDHVGPFARSAADLAIAFDVMHGGAPVAPAIADAVPFRVAVLDGWFSHGATEAALEAVDRVARALGADTRTELPEARRARAAGFCITAAEGGTLHLDRLRTRAGDFDPATRPRLLAGALLPAAIVQQAQRFRAWFAAEASRLFERHDALLAPATPCPAPVLGQATMEIAGETVPVRPHLGLYTQPISFIGLPVVVVPVHGVGPLPLGVQVIAAPGCESVALAIAHRLERDGICAAPVVGPS